MSRLEGHDGVEQQFQLSLEQFGFCSPPELSAYLPGL
jgi:hypothetical protein